ncbi:MAG: riboflavin synthase [Chitinophagaceae bacterium]|nr:riboflavin synthase [Chitinophagaceae bacterium]
MFTGIIENTGTIISAELSGTNKVFWIDSKITSSLKVDESISHNGACLTIEEIKHSSYKVTAINETLIKTNLNSWATGDMINLERAMKLNGRLDGHLVQGHVDTTVICYNKSESGGSFEYSFEFDKKFAALLIEKGSVCLNGISLTAFNVTSNKFTVAVIPYTYHHTNIRMLEINDTVNVEFDMIGKYVQRITEMQKTQL